MTSEFTSDLNIAIVGIACRFPGARNVNEFWRNLRNGVDSISHFTHEEMRSFGVSAEVFESTEFVPAAPVIENADCFDAGFFGYPPKEAAWMDPQHRVFLECAWQALESAGYKPDRCPQPCGIYAGTSISSYLLYNLLPHLPEPHSEDTLQTMIGNDKDFLSTRVSYKLNLHGPSVDVQTGCSTSLVAVHLACQGLLNYHCDMALAGGVSVHTPQRRGYFFQKGGLASPDGRCRAFDAKAEGTVFGSGVGIVVLKRYTDAQRDGDPIVAVIRGSAVNNDGSGKLGFTAPSISGQAEVIRAAQLIAGINARSIGYVECHGTATQLGDPAEITALTNAFQTTRDTNFCAIGSVKSNIGHLDAAAGVAGLIKTALALKHGEIPPSLHFEHPNPQIDFASTPFFVNSTLRAWPASDMPRCAGVSSFGIGGTNAHVVLEEAPYFEVQPSRRSRHILCVSARSSASLEASRTELADFLSAEDQPDIADIAYTLHASRNSYAFRHAVVSTSHADASAALRGNSGTWSITNAGDARRRDVAFMFPGGGSQYLDMGAGLYASEPCFRREIDRCAEILEQWLGCDLRSYLFPSEKSPEAMNRIRGTKLGLPALFAVEYAIAQLWLEWALQPSAMIGHSLGEYTAACVSGVLSLEDALGIVATRSLLMERMSPGAMLSVPLAASELEPLIEGTLSIAAINSATNTVVSGTTEAVENLIQLLAAMAVDSRTLQISVASHSPLVESILPEFDEYVSSIRFNDPQVPYISNLTGDWVTKELVSDHSYWTQHLRNTVLFHKGMQKLLDGPARVLLECGPGNALSTLVQTSPSSDSSTIVLPSMRHPYDTEDDETVLHRTAARLWACGTVDDWARLYHNEKRARVSLPGYAFERQRHWIEPPTNYGSVAIRKASRKNDWKSWVYAPGWKTVPTLPPQKGSDPQSRTWVVMISDDARTSHFAEQLSKEFVNVTLVEQASTYAQLTANRFSIRPEEGHDYGSFLKGAFGDRELPPLTIVHLWGVTPEAIAVDERKTFARMTETVLGSLGHLLRAITERNPDPDLEIAIVADQVFQVEHQDKVTPEKSMLLGPCRSIPQEHPKVRCRLIDVGDFQSSWSEEADTNIYSELHASDCPPIVALRGNRRWVPQYSPVRLPELGTSSLVAENAVYLLIGGTGEIGIEIAKALFNRKQAKIVITSRREYPPPSEWDAILTAPASGLDTSHLHALNQLRHDGAELLLLTADVTDKTSLQDVIRITKERFGAISGVFHLAGVTGPNAVHLVTDARPGQIHEVAEAKVAGIQNLDWLCQDSVFDFIVLFSSTAYVLGGVGLSSYAAANAVTETEVLTANSPFLHTKWLSVAWDAWLTERYNGQNGLPDALREYALSPTQGLNVLFHLLECGMTGPFIVSSGELGLRYTRSFTPPSQPQRPEAILQARTDRPYTPPINDLEKTIADTWQRHLGITRIGRDERFFELGGNSLFALRIVSDLKKQLDRDIPVISVFEGGTVSGMAVVLSAAHSDTDILEESRKRGQARRLRNIAESEEGVLID